ncbi:hypothetical protein [Microcoleus sp. BROC3]
MSNSRSSFRIISKVRQRLRDNGSNQRRQAALNSTQAELERPLHLKC